MANALREGTASAAREETATPLACYCFDSAGEPDTARLARALASLARRGCVITLDGNSGAGKTRFVQAFARAVRVSGTVDSITGTLPPYRCATGRFHHMDAFQTSPQEARELGLESCLDGAAMTLIEWSARIEPLLPAEHLGVYIRNLGWTSRVFVLTPHGARYVRWCETLRRRGTIRRDRAADAHESWR